MHQEAILFVVLVAYYAWECLVWLPRGSVGVFRYFRSTPWTDRAAGELYGNARGGFALCHPVPPLGDFLCSAEFPFSLAPGVLVVAGGSRAAEAEVARTETVRFHARGRVLYAD